MHCLVTGASGFIGQALFPALVQRGHKVSLQHHRQPLEDLNAGSNPLSGVETPDDLRVFSSDFNTGEMQLALDGVDVVFHLAGIAHQQAGASLYQRVNVDASLALVRAAIQANVERFVFVSSVKADAAERDDAGKLVEIPDAKNAYAQSKALAEDGLQRLCAPSKTQLIIVRPALVYGDHARGHLRWLRRWVNLHLPRPPVGGQRSMIAREDLVRLLAELAAFSGTIPALMVATDGHRYSTQRLHAALCAQSGRKPWLPSPPPAVWQCLSGLLDRIRRESPGQTWTRMVGDDCYASDGMAAIGFQPQISFEQSLGVAAHDA